MSLRLTVEMGSRAMSYCPSGRVDYCIVAGEVVSDMVDW